MPRTGSSFSKRISLLQNIKHFGSPCLKLFGRIKHVKIYTLQGDRPPVFLTIIGFLRIFHSQEQQTVRNVLIETLTNLRLIISAFAFAIVRF